MAAQDMDPSDAKLVQQAKSAAAAQAAAAKPKTGDPITGFTPTVTMGANTSGLFVGPIPTGTTRTSTGYTTSVVTSSTTSSTTTGTTTSAATTGLGIESVITSLNGIIEGLQGQLTQALTPKLVTQKTVRKTGGTVQTVNVMSDGKEVVVDEYKDFSARDAVMEMFNNTGLDASFMTSLINSVDTVYNENIAPTDAQILNSIYNSDAYKTRFAANETIRQRIADGKGRPGDRLLKPAEYIETENTYREIMQAAGLPDGFYDNQDDFSNLISNGVSATELTSRVNIAQKALQSADQQIVKSLKDYYGMSTGEMTAYLLDKDKAFNIIEGKFKYTTAEAEKMYGAAEIGGAALRAGGTGAGTMADKAFAEEIYAAGKGGQAEEAFQNATANKKDYKRLLSLYGETGTDQDLARQSLALTGGAEVGIKTKKLASKERAKFQQRGAIDQTSLGRRGKVADV